LTRRGFTKQDSRDIEYAVAKTIGTTVWSWWLHIIYNIGNSDGRTEIVYGTPNIVNRTVQCLSATTEKNRYLYNWGCCSPTRFRHLARCNVGMGRMNIVGSELVKSVFFS
jgi:hypothetical protein